MKAGNMKKLLVGLGIILILAVAAYRYAPSLMVAALFEPSADFDELTAPPAPDYADPSNWAAWPGRADTADQLPTGVTAPPEQARRAAVFYVHPTVFMSNEAWNADTADQNTNMLVDYLPVMGQASAFNKCCQIYAPRYRQATLWTYMGAADQAGKALDLAYQDVDAAFDYFLAALDPTMPIVLASHSQGSTHLYRLLASRIWGTPLQDRLVVAYVVGVYTPASHKEMILPDMPLCATADDVGCLITWDTYRPKGDPKSTPNPMTHWVGQNNYIAPPPVPRLCTSPLDWNEAGGGAVRLAPGGLAATFTGGDPDFSNLPQLGAVDDVPVAGRCLDGGLVLEAPYPAFIEEHPNFGPGGSLHLMDFSIAYMDLFHNAARRVDSYLTTTAAN